MAEWLREAFFGIFLFIDSIIYTFIGYVYQIFSLLTDARVLTDPDMEKFVSRIYTIIGVVMLFIVTYSLLKLLVNPDEASKGDSSAGKLVINIVISFILIAIVPTIFTFARNIQNAIVKDNIIGRIITGKEGSYIDAENNATEDLKLKGYKMSVDIFKAFFYPRDGIPPSEVKCVKQPCWGDADTLEKAYITVAEKGDFSYLRDYNKNAAWITPKDEGAVTYSYLISTVAGLFVLFILVSFCFDLGIRAVALAFYQLMAPIPILSRIIPGQKKIFDNWVKKTVAVYLEVFIRLIILYFAVYLISEVPNIWTNLWNTNALDPSPGVPALTSVVVIMGIIAFMRQAPKLIGELFGLDSGKIKLGIGEKLAAGGAFVAGGIVGGGLTSMARNITGQDWRKGNRMKALGGALKGSVAGLGAGAVRGGKGNIASKNFADMKKNTGTAIKDTTTARKTRAAYKADHGGNVATAMWGHIKDTGRSGLGLATGDKQYFTDNSLSEAEYHGDVIKSHKELRSVWGSEYDDKVTQLEAAQASTGQSAGDPGYEYYQKEINKAKAQRKEYRSKNVQATAYRLDEHLSQLLANKKIAQKSGYNIGNIESLKAQLTRDANNNILFGGVPIDESDLDNILNMVSMGNTKQYVKAGSSYTDISGVVHTVAVGADGMYDVASLLGKSSGSFLSSDAETKLKNSPNYQELLKSQESKKSSASANNEKPGDKPTGGSGIGSGTTGGLP